MHHGLSERFERGMPEEKRRLLGRPEKYTDLTHAERDAIYCAIRGGFGDLLVGATMYYTWNPCILCAEMIANSGIKRVVSHTNCDKWYGEKMEDSKRVSWDKSIKDALTLLEKCGVKYEYSDIPLTGVEIRFDDIVRRL
jgi:deoxycytidylate deaminase